MRISDWSSDVCSSDLFEQFGQVRRQRRGARVAALEAVEHLAQRALQAFGRQVELAQDAADVAVVDLDQLEQEVFDLDIVVAARQAQAGGGLQCGPAGGRSEEHTSELQSLMRISY